MSERYSNSYSNSYSCLAWPGFPAIYVAIVLAEFAELTRRALRRTRPSR